jgi:hypothetical protein
MFLWTKFSLRNSEKVEETLGKNDGCQKVTMFISSDTGAERVRCGSQNGHLADFGGSFFCLKSSRKTLELHHLLVSSSAQELRIPSTPCSVSTRLS